MYAPLDACVHPSHQMFGSACHIRLLTCDSQDALYYELEHGLSHPNGTDLWMLIQYNQPPYHQITVCLP